MGIRTFACALFGHDFEMISETSLRTTIVCGRCGSYVAYDFEVEDEFWFKHWPEWYDDPNEPDDGVPAK